MALSLNQKERSLLEDQRKHEEVCIQKYTGYANQTKDQELKQLFNQYANQEKQHLDSINQMLSGQIPNTQQGQGAGGQQNQGGKPKSASPQSGIGNAADAILCNDALMTEKYVSSAYDTAVFEFTDTNVRQTLNHIQKEEQQHGEGIFNYMRSKGMYNVQ